MGSLRGVSLFLFIYFLCETKRDLVLIIDLDVHRLAAFLEGQGIKNGVYVAVFMANSPEMIITILALSKLGAVSGLINTNLRGECEKIILRTFTDII